MRRSFYGGAVLEPWLAWFFWSFFVIFTPGGFLFLWIWRLKRRNWHLTVAERRRATAVVVDRQERMITSSSPDESRLHVRITLEFRDHRRNLHRFSVAGADIAAFLPRYGQRTEVVYDPNNPTNAELVRVNTGGLAMFLIGSIAFFFVGLGSLGAALYITLFG